MDAEGTQATMNREAAKRSARPPVKSRGIFSRDGAWWISWCCTEEHRHRQRIGPRGLAIQEHGARRKEVEKAQRLGVPYCPDVERKRRLAERRKHVPFKEIAQDFLDYAKDHKRDRNDGYRMGRLLATFGEKVAAQITPKNIEDYKAALADQVAPATVNRDLALLKTVFNRAIRAGKVRENPVRAVPLFKENNARTRCLSDEEEARLYEALPEYLKPLLTVALNTGMRWGELASLRWEEVDFYTGTLHIRESKSGEGRRIPMNRIVRESLQGVRRDQIQRAREQTLQQGSGQADGVREILSPFVFCAPQGGFLFNFKRDWYPALRRTEIPDFRWHDTRHTAASRLVMAGVDLYTVKEILGHKTLAMTARYSHLSPGHQRQALERLADLCAVPGQAGRQAAQNSAEQVALLVAPEKTAQESERCNVR